MDFRLEYVENLVEIYGYSLINSGRYSYALVLENCFEVYLNSADFYFIIGLVYMNNAEFTRAIEWFLECTKFKHSKVEGVYRLYHIII